jgi:hypothetical protein
MLIAKTTVRRFLSTLTLSLAALAGCAGGPTGEAPEQLEAVAVQTTMDELQTDLPGTLAVSGSGRDFKLEVGSGDSLVAIDVHSPGLSNLAKLDGRDAIVRLAQAGIHTERSLSIVDNSGPLYVANVGHGVDKDVEAWFGSGFARWGEASARLSDETYEWEYTSAVFKTDEGEVSVFPASTATLKLNGATYRVAVIAAYKVTPHPDAALPCGGISDLLSYELLRVEEAEEPEKLGRHPELQFAHLGCMAGDGEE